MAGRTWMTETMKAAIVSDRASGVPVKVICQRYNIDPTTVWRQCRKIQLAHPASAVARNSTELDLKTRIQTKAYGALESGLDCVDDLYKRSAIGIAALKEMGSLQELGASNAGEREFLRQLSGLSEETQMRYLNPPPRPEPRILSADEHENWALDVFRESGMTAIQFNRERESARRGRRRLITGSEEVEEFFRAEEVRAAMVKTR